MAFRVTVHHYGVTSESILNACEIKLLRVFLLSILIPIYLDDELYFIYFAKL